MTARFIATGLEAARIKRAVIDRPYSGINSRITVTGHYDRRYKVLLRAVHSNFDWRIHREIDFLASRQNVEEHRTCSAIDAESNADSWDHSPRDSCRKTQARA